MLNKLVLYLSLLLFLIISCSKPNEEHIAQSVYLTGSIKNYEKDTIYLENYTLKGKTLREEQVKLPLQEDKSFVTTLQLSEPTYFRIGRNFLYLTPGDSLVAHLDAYDRKYSRYSGQGSEANTYLTSLLYPKAGSFWGNRYVLEEVKNNQDVIRVFEKEKKKRSDWLLSLQHVSPDFVALESKRLDLDMANSLLNSLYLELLVYQKMDWPKQAILDSLGQAEKLYQPYITQALQVDYNHDEDLLSLEVFQSMLKRLNDEQFVRRYQITPLNQNLQDYVHAVALLRSLSKEGYSHTFSEKYEQAKQRHSPYLAVVQEEVEAYQKIIPGQTAPDLTFLNTDGEHVNLSAFKDKTIVMDFWATWCGPCMKEKPSFKKVEEEFKKQDDVVFLSVSIDNKKTWQAYVQQHEAEEGNVQIDRNKLGDYNIEGIPRFVVIDKAFRIVDAFAPRPSSGRLEEIIQIARDKR